MHIACTACYCTYMLYSLLYSIKHWLCEYLQCAFPLFTQGTLQGVLVSQKQKISYKTYLYNGEISYLLCSPLKQQDLQSLLVNFMFGSLNFSSTSVRTMQRTQSVSIIKNNFGEILRTSYQVPLLFFPIVTRIWMGQQLLFRIQYNKFHWNHSAEWRFFTGGDEANGRFLQLLC